MEMLSSSSTLYYTQSYHICGILCTLSHMLSYIAMGSGGLCRGPPVMNISELSVMLDNRADTQIHTYTQTHTATQTLTHDSDNNDESHCKDDNNDKDVDDGHGNSNVSISAIVMVMALTIAQLM